MAKNSLCKHTWSTNSHGSAKKKQKAANNVLALKQSTCHCSATVVGSSSTQSSSTTGSTNQCCASVQTEEEELAASACKGITMIKSGAKDKATGSALDKSRAESGSKEEKELDIVMNEQEKLSKFVLASVPLSQGSLLTSSCIDW